MEMNLGRTTQQQCWTLPSSVKFWVTTCDAGENLANSILRVQKLAGVIKPEQVTTSENREDDVTKRSPSVYTNQWPVVHVECDHIPSSHDDKCDQYAYEA
jgi:hypothetical protein